MAALLTTNRLGAVAVASVLTYGVKVGMDTSSQRRTAYTRTMQEEEVARQKQNEMLLDQYGDRDSLEALERAVQFYDKK
jgi:hypothetical protein